uniref:Fibroblast growth factor 6b n=1 Tax=Apteryx owenii TaxID=8824 RepID=A0A8B9NWG4_APTOW
EEWPFSFLLFFSALPKSLSCKNKYNCAPVKVTNGTLLERGWQALLSRSIAGKSGEKSDVNWESDYLLGIKRQRRLYCNVGIGFHLQILPDERISGVHRENRYSELLPEMK